MNQSSVQSISEAACQCGAVQVTCLGAPKRVSICHCLECKARTGSAFGHQAWWLAEKVSVSGVQSSWLRTADSGYGVRYHFCPRCGTTTSLALDSRPGYVGIPAGSFDPALQFDLSHSVYEHRQVDWLEVTAPDIERTSTPSTLRKWHAQ